jgi:hypothetical protein
VVFAPHLQVARDDGGGEVVAVGEVHDGAVVLLGCQEVVQGVNVLGQQRLGDGRRT